jgi:hypothetical protein
MAATKMNDLRKAINDDEARYQFSEPLHIMFAYAVQKEPPIINGHQLTVEEQKALALMVFECARQNCPWHVATQLEEVSANASYLSPTK